MSKNDDLDPIFDLRLPTRVGRADYGENQFCGFPVNASLVDRDGYWSTVSLALGHRRLSDIEAANLEMLSVAALAADPHIWPPKLTRLLAAYGSCQAGLAAGILFESSMMGPASAPQAAQLFTDLFVQIHGTASDNPPPEPKRIVDLIRSHIRYQKHFKGFGVPGRPADERLIGIDRWMQRTGRHTMPHWTLFRHLRHILETERGVHANIMSASVAIFLDIGFQPYQTDTLFALTLQTALLANAFEGAQQHPSLLQALPPCAIDYQGPPRRLSPRAVLDPENSN